MKKYSFILLVVILLLPAFIGAEEFEKFLDLPLISGAQTSQESEKRLEMKTGLSHDEALNFYKKVIKEKGYPDIKFREWKDATYIEDDGKLAWHSITISKNDSDGTTVAIVKDNFTWIISTLVIRYIGVFVVLLVLFLAMSLSGRVLSRLIQNKDKK
jgi:hypothetical protein